MPELALDTLEALVEELADAHLDTLVLAQRRDRGDDREWALHLAYVQDLCRASQGALARRRAA